MSGRGRGGARGGLLKGATWDQGEDKGVKLENAPSELFPKHPGLTQPRSLSAEEKRIVKNYKSFQQGIHSGPKYTAPTKCDPNAPAKTFSEAQVNSQYGARGKADVDPFTAVPTYSVKYDPPKRTLPDVGGIQFDKRIFPKELWGTIEGEEGEEVKRHIARALEKKSFLVDGTKKAVDKDKNRGDTEDKGKRIQARIDAVTQGVEEGEDEDNEDREEEPQDDDYEDDEDGGDYNAEQYFDDGENDDDDGEDGEGDY